MTTSATTPCPCGSGSAYASCCGPYLLGARPPTAEALMRSRYTAFATGDVDHLWRTWHPRTRPADVTIDPAVRWTGLEVVATDAGREHDDHGTVRFVATFDGPAGVGHLAEASSFVRRGGRWVYVDGTTGT